MERMKAMLTKYNKEILVLFLGMLANISLSYLLNLIMEDTNFSFSFSVLIIPVWAVVFYVIRKFIMAIQNERVSKVFRRRLRYSLILAIVFGLSMIAGYQLQVHGYTLHGAMGKIFILLMGIGIGVCVLPIFYGYFAWLDKRKEGKVLTESKDKPVIKSFWISWGLIFIMWIPAFLAYYPAIMSYDCHRQFQEAYTGFFNTHHPLVHTFLIRVFMLLGKSMGSYEIGMAMFSISQMLILSVIFAYACNWVGRLTHKKWAVVCAVAFLGLLPIHHVLVLCITKDILFTAFFLLLCLLLLEFNQTDTKVKKVLLFVAILLVGILVMLFRNNAIYAFAVFAVLYIIWSKKERLVIAMLCLAILLGGTISAGAIQTALDAGSGNEVEMYSVFVQQFARIGLYQNDNLDIEEYGLINRYVDSVYWSMYNPHISDGIKNNVGVSTFEDWKNDIPTMLKDWITIGIKYPNDFIDAFLELTRGYWFLDDVSHAEVLGYGDDINWGLLYTFNVSESDLFEGVESKSFLPGLQKIYQKIVNGNSYYDWPIISMLFKPAFYCWTLVLVMVSLMYMKQNRKLILCLFPLTYLLTLLLGPVVNFRYVYPIMVVAPVLVAWMFSNCDWKIKDGKKVAEK